ncbi:MAG: hypothetical protein AAGI12_03650 [Pseudomonadota bacterium]
MIVRFSNHSSRWCVIGCVCAAGVSLSACVGTPAYEALQPNAPLPASNPAVRNSGNTPNLLVQPAAQAKQISDEEKKALETEMKRAGVRNATATTRSQSQSEAIYRREVEAMRREADNHAQRRLREIERRSN